MDRSGPQLHACRHSCAQPDPRDESDSNAGAGGLNAICWTTFLTLTVPATHSSVGKKSLVSYESRAGRSRLLHSKTVRDFWGGETGGFTSCDTSHTGWYSHPRRPVLAMAWSRAGSLVKSSAP
jgi:hypothetical protein